MKGPTNRTYVAFAASLLVHVGAVVALLGVSTVQSLSLLRTDVVEISTVTEPPKDLPLGAPAAAKKRARPRIQTATNEATIGGAAAARDAGADDHQADASAGAVKDAGTETATTDAGAHDLRTLGPDGSRVTALIRLDRLRVSPHATRLIPATDQLLRLLPDRRRLLDGSGMDLYRDFDLLLVATPNPVDDAVTFLVARHHLSDAAIKTGLERSAANAGRPLAWRTERGRLVGTRALPHADPNAPPERDDRLILLPAPGLAVMAAPVYAKLLLNPPDAGAASTDWHGLVDRLDGETASMPQDAALTVVASNLFAARATATFPAAQTATLTVTSAAEPAAQLRLDFKETSEAVTWERELPALRSKALANPLVALGGFVPLLSRITIERDDATIIVRAPMTVDELVRLMTMAGNFARGGRPQ